MLVKKIRNIVIWIYSIPINYKIFPREIARKLPLRVNTKVKCSGLYKGCIEIRSDYIYKGMIQIGLPMETYSHNDKTPSCLHFETNKGKIIFYGKADFYESVAIRIYEDGVLEIDDGFFCNSNASINVSKKVSIGKMAQWGWNVEIIDTDGHDILDESGNKINPDKEIFIGDNVWIGANSTVLKGAVIPDGCIVGYGSLVSKRFEKKNTIMAGVPAKVVKYDIHWRREKS